MVKNQKILVICFALFSFALIGRAQDAIAAPTEASIAASAVKLLDDIDCRQRIYKYNNGRPYPQCAGACWNSSSIVDSNRDLETALTDITALNLSVDVGALGGDVRFRCRYQGGSTYCFAYRCADKDPHGCKQMWRIEKSGSDPNRGFKCTDVDRTEPDGICSGVDKDTGGIKAGFVISCDLPAPGCIPD